MLSAEWTFTVRDTVDSVAPVRQGFMAVIPPSADSLEMSLIHTLTRAATHLLKGSYSEPLNVLHVGFSQQQEAGDGLAALAQTALQQHRAHPLEPGVR